VIPVPAVIIAILIFLGLLAAALKWDEIVLRWSGSVVAVLGERGVGKTQLIRFLYEGEVPETAEQTLTAEAKGKTKYKLRELNLDIRKCTDVAGGKDAYPEWKKLFKEADIVFYLFRADLLKKRDSDVEERVTDDSHQIRKWIDSRDRPPLLFIIGTHCDLDPEFSRCCNPKTWGDYNDEFTELPFINGLKVRLGSEAKILVGGLNTKENLELLMYSVLSHLDVFKQ